jgi:hypothetical protein
MAMSVHYFSTQRYSILFLFCGYFSSKDGRIIFRIDLQEMKWQFMD